MPIGNTDMMFCIGKFSATIRAISEQIKMESLEALENELNRLERTINLQTDNLRVCNLDIGASTNKVRMFQQGNRGLETEVSAKKGILQKVEAQISCSQGRRSDGIIPLFISLMV